MVKKKEEKEIGEGLGISGFTLGVLSIVLVLNLAFLSSIISIIGFVFCMIQQKHNPKKLGKIGIILNIIGFVLGIIITIILGIFAYQYMMQEGVQQVAQGTFPIY
jgi:hypothetical protein